MVRLLMQHRQRRSNRRAPQLQAYSAQHSVSGCSSSSSSAYNCSLLIGGTDVHTVPRLLLNRCRHMLSCYIAEVFSWPSASPGGMQLGTILRQATSPCAELMQVLVFAARLYSLCSPPTSWHAARHSAGLTRLPPASREYLAARSTATAQKPKRQHQQHVQGNAITNANGQHICT
jgi:hypothetical protein